MGREYIQWERFKLFAELAEKSNYTHAEDYLALSKSIHQNRVKRKKMNYQLS
jgi:hypothetical protein